jgi:hypothetical protein
LLLEEKKLLYATIHIRADIIPGVGGVVFVGIGPRIRQVDFASLRMDIRERV